MTCRRAGGSCRGTGAVACRAPSARIRWLRVHPVPAAPIATVALRLLSREATLAFLGGFVPAYLSKSDHAVRRRGADGAILAVASVLACPCGIVPPGRRLTDL